MTARIKLGEAHLTVSSVTGGKAYTVALEGESSHEYTSTAATAAQIRHAARMLLALVGEEEY